MDISAEIKKRISNADVGAVCQLIRHYNEISGGGYNVSLIGPGDNNYSSQKLRSVSFDGKNFLISVSDAALLGTSGALPRMLEVPITQNRNNGSTAGSDFINILEKRYYVLSFSVLQKNNLARQRENESFRTENKEYGVSELLASLAGIAPGREFRYLDKRSLIRYATFLGSREGNLSSLLKILKNYFRLELVATSDKLEMRHLRPEALTKIGSKGNMNCLGINTQLGSKVPIYARNVRIRIIIKSYQEYQRVFMDSRFLGAVKELTNFFMGDSTVVRFSVDVDASCFPKYGLLSRNSRLVLGRNVCISSGNMRGRIEIPIRN